MAYPYVWAERKFLEVLNAVKEGATDVYEVRSIPLTNKENMKKMIDSTPHNSALWQHTDQYHVAMIYIERGKGQRFNRSLLDLIGSGIDTKEKFKREWRKRNGNNDGYFPKVSKSSTSQNRMRQSSYIVADLNKGANPKSKIQGHDGNTTTHRTHLISAQTTGIENNKGLLIDFDGWLNMKPLNDFETQVLEMTKFQDIIWTATVWRAMDGLHFRYLMFDSSWRVVASHEWVDDRWTYLWYYDDEQVKK